MATKLKQEELHPKHKPIGTTVPKKGGVMTDALGYALAVTMVLYVVFHLFFY